ncbi:RagB/SusD family nutrient uptake outer membrane protein [Pedobacter agri]|uniref:RagB/SusD family nutrient uptake outer membrane protein n=1 Tax=Pedobacter agri TaxID=454586 RepID=UPI00292F2D22|nr:RagB/SusD family nutrient uptake outer membrane protein [Pedobacter agri]
MKKYFYNNIKSKALLLTLASITLFSACEKNDDLKIAPPTTISDADIFKSPARIEGLVNGIYKALKGASLYGGRFLLYQDARGEDFINVTANNYTAYEAWNNSYSSGSNDINNLWGAAYTAINNANIVIEGLAANPGVVTAQKTSEYVAEAKLVRALAYYSLIISFGQPYNKDGGASKGVPLRLKAENGPENNNLARSSVAQVYAQIIKDLNEAEAALPQNYTSNELNTTRAHTSTAIALKTRVYLTTNQWSKVIEEAVKLVPQTQAPFSTTATAVKHALQTNIANIFASDYTSVESIFSIPMSTLDSYTGQSAIAYIYNTNSEFYVNPTGILGDAQWGSTDRRRSFLRLSSGKQFFRKYAKPSPFLDYIPVIRYAEVLLNYAEAAAKTGNLVLAQNLLRAVHQRSDASYVFPAAAISTETALIETIWKERRIEFIGEGFRGPDLLRNLQPLPAKGDSNLQTPAVPLTAENYIFPAPNTELSTNKLY